MLIFCVPDRTKRGRIDTKRGRIAARTPSAQKRRIAYTTNCMKILVELCAICFH